jgi:hypothetical protein
MNYNFLKSLTVFFIIILISACQENAMSNEVNVELRNTNEIKEQRFIELKVDSSGIDYYINFNDVEIFSEIKESPVNQVLPINQWTVNGENKLLVSVNYQDKDNALKLAQSAELKVSVMLRIKNGDTQQSYTLTQFDLGVSDEQLTLIEKGEIERTLENKNALIASKSWDNKKIDLATLFTDGTVGIVKVGGWSSMDKGAWTRFEQPVSMDLAYPEWAYLSGDDLGDSSKMSDEEFYALSDELYLEYKKVWQLMKNKNKAELLPLFALRASEFDAAFYLPDGEKLADMDDSLTSAFNHDALYLDDMVSNMRVAFRIQGNQKIAFLKVDKVFEPLVFFSHKREAFTRFYDMYFMRKDGKWIIIR